MELFELVPASVCNNNKISTTQAVTKLELPKYQPEQYTMYQIVLLGKERNKNLSVTVDFLVDKTFSSYCIKLPKLRNFFAWCRNWSFTVNFSQQLRHKIADVPDIYFFFIDAADLSPTQSKFFVNQHFKVIE